MNCNRFINLMNLDDSLKVEVVIDHIYDLLNKTDENALIDLKNNLESIFKNLEADITSENYLIFFIDIIKSFLFRTNITETTTNFFKTNNLNLNSKLSNIFRIIKYRCRYYYNDYSAITKILLTNFRDYLALYYKALLLFHQNEFNECLMIINEFKAFTFKESIPIERKKAFNQLELLCKNSLEN